MLFVFILDGPLNLRAFDWPEPPKDNPGQPKNVGLKVSSFVVVIVVAIAGFASLIPQVESPAPEALEITGDLSGEELAVLGEEVVRSADSGCLACHAIGSEGLRAPDLAGIGGRAAERVPGLSAEEYLFQSIEDPCAYVVEGYDCIMPPTLAQTLGPAKVTAVVAFMQSLGGEITVSLSAEAVAGEAEATGGVSGIAGTTAEEIMTNAGCIGCHKLEAIGAVGAIGPDLSMVGARLSPEEIRRSILDPDAVIAEECPTPDGPGPCTPGLMPKILGDQLSGSQLETLVTFLSELQ
jgi:cytochrome c2